MKKLGKIVSLFLATVLSVAAVSTLVACGGGGKKAKSLIIMTDSLDGLFNPFFYTSAPDGTIVEKNLRGEAVEQAVAKYIK